MGNTCSMVSHDPPPRLTLFLVLAAAGNIMLLSVVLTALWLGIVTAGPGSAAVMDARTRMKRDDTSVSIRDIVRDTAAYFSGLWPIGPAVLVIGIAAWISTAFWLAAPQPLGPLMIAATIVIAASTGMIALALPLAAHPGDSTRTTLKTAVRIVAVHPWNSIIALAASAAAVLLAFQFPQFGVVILGGALAEISFRAWSTRALAAETDD
jgi:uncharacterized membrane protein YesL